MAHKFENLTYADMHEMRHSGVGHRTGQCITVHIANMLDDSSRYRVRNGKVEVRDLNVKRGRIVKERKFIRLEEHNRKYYPKIRSPLM